MLLHLVHCGLPVHLSANKFSFLVFFGVYPLAALPKLTGTFSRVMESRHQLNPKQLISSLNEYSCVLEVSSKNAVTEWKM